jgi:hypothetical protein
VTEQVADFRREVDDAAVTYGSFTRWMLGISVKIAPNSAGESDPSAISAVDTRRVANFLRHKVGYSQLLQILRPSAGQDGAAPLPITRFCTAILK